MRHFLRGLALVSLSTLSACSGSEGGNSQGTPSGPGFSAEAVASLTATGVGKYIGVAEPTGSTPECDAATSGCTSPGATTYEFDSNDGPICLWGTNFTASIKDRGSDNLLIFLEGGGACWTGFCGSAKPETTRGMPQSGVLDANTTTNALASWNVLYVPYCDGSVFSGDNELPDTGPAGQTTRHHRGLRNLTAALDLAKSHFPNPARIVLAGSSAGGFGTIMGTGVTRLLYPNTPLIVFNDSGLGLTPPGATFDIIKADWKFTQFIPADCVGCDAETTKVIAWGLRADPTLRAAGFSAYNDAVITLFLGITADAFRTMLLERTGQVQSEFPDRFKRFLINGEAHTTLMVNNNPTPGTGLAGYYDEYDGIKISDWTRAFVDDSDAWVEHLQ